VALPKLYSGVKTKASGRSQELQELQEFDGENGKKQGFNRVGMTENSALL
jgi:hypothetical protein